MTYSYVYKKKKIAFFINTVTSYTDEFFTELKKYFEIKVFFYSKNYQNYNFKIKKNKNYSFSRKNTSVINFLKLNDPDFIVLGGYRLPNTNKIIKFCEKENKKYGKLVGKGMSDLKIELGNPTEDYINESGNKVFVYKTKKYGIPCERKFEINQNNIVESFTSIGCI